MLALVPDKDKEMAIQKAIKAGYKPPKKTDQANEAWSVFKQAEGRVNALKTWLDQQQSKLDNLFQKADEAKDKVIELDAQHQEAILLREDLRMAAMASLKAEDFDSSPVHSQLKASLSDFGDQWGIPSEGIQQLAGLLATAYAGSAQGPVPPSAAALKRKSSAVAADEDDDDHGVEMSDLNGYCPTPAPEDLEAMQRLCATQVDDDFGPTGRQSPGRPGPLGNDDFLDMDTQLLKIASLKKYYSGTSC